FEIWIGTEACVARFAIEKSCGEDVGAVRCEVPQGGSTSTLVTVNEVVPFMFDVSTRQGIMRPCTGWKSAMVMVVTTGPAVCTTVTGRWVALSNRTSIGTLELGGVTVSTS